MTDLLNSCPTCGMQMGQCVHENEGRYLPTRPQPADAAPAAISPVSVAAGGADRKLAKHFRKRIVSVERAACIDGLALTMMIGDSQFTICAPTMDELGHAFSLLERAQGVRYPAMSPERVQAVCLLDQRAVTELKS